MSLTPETHGHRRWDVIVIGGGGLQAKAMFEAAARGKVIGTWLAADRAWRPDRVCDLERLGVQTTTVDVLGDPTALRELTASARIVANFAGPYYRTGGVVLDACIATGTDYLDICDDSDATLALLERDDAATTAGVRALIGMGSSPGVTNILVRAAVDALGSADEVALNWVVDVADMSGAAAQHFFHIFSLIDPDGTRHEVPAWEGLVRRTVEFPDPVGAQTLVELAHPEPITLPRFLPVERVVNFGGVIPGRRVRRVLGARPPRRGRRRHGGAARPEGCGERGRARALHAIPRDAGGDAVPRQRPDRRGAPRRRGAPVLVRRQDVDGGVDGHTCRRRAGAHARRPHAGEGRLRARVPGARGVLPDARHGQQQQRVAEAAPDRRRPVA